MNKIQLTVIIIIIITSIVVLTAPTYSTRYRYSEDGFVNWSIVFQRIIPILLIGGLLIYFLRNKIYPFKKSIDLFRTKKFKVIIVSFGIVIILGIGIVTGIGWINEGLAKSNAKYVVIKNYSIIEISISKENPFADLIPKNYNLIAILKNNSDRVVKRVDLELNYYTPDNYFIDKSIIDDFTDGSIITPQPEPSSISKTVILPFKHVSEQEIEKRLRVYRVYFR